MKTIFGILLIIVGVCLGLYVGLWWAFIGGIVDVITEIRAEIMDAMNIAIGIAKVLFAGFLGYLSAIFCVIPGYLLVQIDD